MAVCLVVAAALHVLVLQGIDLPLPPTPTVRSPIELRLTTSSEPKLDAAKLAETERAAAEPVATADAQEAAASPPAVGGDTLPQRPAGPELPSPEQTPPVARRLAGLSAIDLAQAVATSAAHPQAVGAPGPRVHRLGDAATPARPDFAYYLASWRRKVTRIGQLNYPSEAQANGVTGSLRLLVAITADGDLKEVRVLESSGHKLLDDAAVRIVHLAAPFAPFSPAMRESTDMLEIDRTWRFRNSRMSS